MLTLLSTPALRGQAPLVTPDIPGVVAGGTPVTLVEEGLKSSEGPIAASDGSLLFTESSDNKIYRIDALDRMSVFYDAKHVDDPKGERWRMPALAMDISGRIFAARRAGSHIGIAIVFPPEDAKFVAETFEGKSFGAPNDMSMAKNGGIFFTDPGNNDDRRRSVFYVSPSGSVVRATAGLSRPNGIILSRDEKTLFVVDSDEEYVLMYDVQPGGTVTNRRNFVRLQGVKRTATGGVDSGIDGLAIDNLGRLYAISHAGIEVFAADGAALGVIPVPVKAQNLAFAGADRKTLYILGRGNVYKVKMLAQGFTGRAK